MYNFSPEYIQEAINRARNFLGNAEIGKKIREKLNKESLEEQTLLDDLLFKCTTNELSDLFFYLKDAIDRDYKSKTLYMEVINRIKYISQKRLLEEKSNTLMLPIEDYVNFISATRLVYPVATRPNYWE